MSDRLPAVSGKQLIGVLEQRGWYLKRPISKGTLANLLRTAQLSREDLRSLL